MTFANRILKGIGGNEFLSFRTGLQQMYQTVLIERTLDRLKLNVATSNRKQKSVYNTYGTAASIGNVWLCGDNWPRLGRHKSPTVGPGVWGDRQTRYALEPAGFRRGTQAAAAGNDSSGPSPRRATPYHDRPMASTVAAGRRWPPSRFCPALGTP